MFRGNPFRTGVSASKIPRKPSLLWVTEVGPTVSSPLFLDGVIYISTITGRIFALDPSRKQLKWHLNVGSPVVSSPLLYNGTLVVASYDSWIKGTSFAGKNFVVGIDTENGKKIWECEIPGDIFSSPCLVDDMTIVIGSINNGVYALDGISGNIIWKLDTGGEIWSSASYNGDEVFIGSDDGFLYCLDVDGKLRWKTKLNGKIRSSSPCLSLNEDRSSSVFIGTYNGGMFCLNQSTGIISWSKQISKPVMASPAMINDKVIFATSDKRIYGLQATDGSRIWDFETNDKIWSSPSVSEYEGVMFFGSLDSHIYGIDIVTGKQTWKFPTMNIVDSSGAIANNMLFIGSRDGLFYVFGSEARPTYIR
jgi:outer membrane protein assembly factor BamB